MIWWLLAFSNNIIGSYKNITGFINLNFICRPKFEPQRKKDLFCSTYLVRNLELFYRIHWHFSTHFTRFLAGMRSRTLSVSVAGRIETPAGPCVRRKLQIARWCRNFQFFLLLLTEWWKGRLAFPNVEILTSNEILPDWGPKNDFKIKFSVKLYSTQNAKNCETVSDRIYTLLFWVKFR